MSFCLSLRSCWQQRSELCPMFLCCATGRELFAFITGWEVLGAPQQTVLVPPLPLPALSSSQTMADTVFSCGFPGFWAPFHVKWICFFPYICKDTVNVAAISTEFHCSYNNCIKQEQIQWLESSVPLTDANYIIICSIISRKCNNYAKFSYT